MAESRTKRRIQATVITVLAFLVATVSVLALLGFGVGDDGAKTPTAHPTASATPLDVGDLDALQTRRIDELRTFADWLDGEGARGFVGEVGWPAGDADWEALARAWYLVAADRGVPSTAWAAGSWWPSEYPLAIYRAEAGTHQLGGAESQAALVEAQPDPGVNVAGLEFGTEDGFSSAEPGQAGVTYYAEPAASYAYLASRGITTVRLPVRWERLQPEQGGTLDPDYLALVQGQVDAAAEAGMRIVLDLHNYGTFVTAQGPQVLDAGSLLDVWLRLDRELGDHEAVAAYGLMNEPHDLTGDVASGAALWEGITQEVVAGLREGGVDTTLYVAGYDWSSLARWPSIHPSGWIEDPLGDFRYEAHHYWDGDGSGEYRVDYADELAATRSSGAAGSGAAGSGAAGPATAAWMSSATRFPSRTA